MDEGTNWFFSPRGEPTYFQVGRYIYAPGGQFVYNESAKWWTTWMASRLTFPMGVIGCMIQTAMQHSTAS